MPDFNRQMENLSAAGPACRGHQRPILRIDIRPPMKPAPTAELTKYSTLRQQMAAKGQQYQQAVIAREQAKSTFVQASSGPRRPGIWMMTHCSSSPHGSIGARTTTRKNSRLPDRPQTYSAIWRGTSTPRPPTQEPLNDFPLLPLFSLPSVALARNGHRPGPPDPGRLS